MGKKYGSRQKAKGKAQIANKQLVSNAPSLSEALKAMENKAFQNDGFMENFATTQMLWETQKENEGNKLYDVKKINKCFVDGMKSLRCNKTDCLQFPTKFYKPNQETPAILYCEGHSKTADCSKLNLEMIKNRFNGHFNNIATLDKQWFIVQNQIENMKRESVIYHLKSILIVSEKKA